ncbi:MAG: response regulator transcription factor [Actinomycetota bacterium]|nr:response regulator transcription factor [Actinomycetota bacterium]
MHLLVLTQRAGGGKSLLPSLEYLDHTLQDAALDPSALTGVGECDVIVIDGTADLREAAATCRSAAVNIFDTPVLVVISEGGLAALKSTWGFHDWVLPHASPGEVETRLRLVADRAEAARADRRAEVGDLVVDEDSYQVRLRGEPLDLTYKEFELLKTLAGSPGRVFTREMLLQDVWGYDYFGGTRTVDVHIRRVRAKLGPEHESMVVTVRGVGYKMVPPGERA